MSQSKRLKKENTTCSCCRRVLLNERYVRCQRCLDYNQCLQCLSVGMETENHVRTHNFIVIEPKPGSLYTQDWDAHDEILLLYGVKIFGLGNWNDIANFMKSKNAIDCESHYIGVYLHSPTAPLPIADRILAPIPKPPPPPYDTRPVESCPSVAHEKHMNEKNKKEKTIPAEYSGYMPYRHEFEVDWNNDAEMLVAKIEFKIEEDTFESFKNKICLLLSYNGQLAERRFRTKVIEDWDVQNQEVKPVARGEKDELRVLGGLSKAERAIDNRIISLAPYYGYENMQRFSSGLHKRIRFVESIHKLYQWQKNGVRSHAEGDFFTSLLRCIKEGRIPHSEFDHWNELVTEFNRIHGEMSIKNDEFLSPTESQLCAIEHIHPQLYLGLKCLLVRESTWRGVLTKEDALKMDNEHQFEISKIYDLLLTVGILDFT
ncbi:Myb-like DNA-binding domain containing protein [Tritrichomonas foetus]|uniref:Myb-like DNA-binding domain containing protein n=1 Tax=Tritrichomonas foetus TaxID=1144522 RepID=A0A1J4K4B3_9EUKA|nr:Myb-like DNA-binding domain containing protein [Tritrichomonas foetus]|eukprot:OHT04526.1 Myb-like DNA-binding domain containing protein [Tritrichomonas foetus]